MQAGGLFYPKKKKCSLKIHLDYVMTTPCSTGPVGSFQELEEFTVCMFLISCKHGIIFTTFSSHKDSDPLQDGLYRKLWQGRAVSMPLIYFGRVATSSDVGGWSKVLIRGQLLGFWQGFTLTLPVTEDDTTPSLRRITICVYSSLEEQKNPSDYCARLIKTRFLECL